MFQDGHESAEAWRTIDSGREWVAVGAHSESRKGFVPGAGQRQEEHVGVFGFAKYLVLSGVP